MRLLVKIILALMMVLLNGCSNKEYLFKECPKVDCKYPKLTTYKTPKKVTITPLRSTKDTVTCKKSDLIKGKKRMNSLDFINWKYTKMCLEHNRKFVNEKH
jgi:hypothetical protein